MTSSHSAERPLANMVAAVSHDYPAPSPSLSPTAPAAPPFLEPAVKLPSPTLPGPFRASDPAAGHGERFRSLCEYTTTHHHARNHPHYSDRGAMDQDPLASAPSRTLSFPFRQRSLSPQPRRPISPDSTQTVRRLHRDDSPERFHPHTHDSHRSLTQPSTSLTDHQNHHMRSSPPIQPGEQNFPGKLPSFSEFLNTTRNTTPPRTPQRRNDSAESSPHAQPHFDDVAWSDSKRRRVDTLGDIYARGTVEQSFAEPRRMSNAIDPALSGYSPHVVHQHVGQSVGPGLSHRPSPSYPPPHHQPHPMNPHVRHQSSPAPQSHISYGQPSIHQSVAQSPYQQPMVQQGYYHDPQPSVYSYDRPQDSYYPRPGYPTYDTPYGDIRFQHNVGLDHSAFNRKRRGNLPKEATNLLKEWFAANRQSPYPTEDQKMDLCNRTGLSLNQVSNWFINARRRAPQKEQRERDANGPEA